MLFMNRWFLTSWIVRTNGPVDVAGTLGIRMALGAQMSDVLKLVLKNGMSLALIGAALGVAGAFAATRVMSSLLFGVAPTDLTTFTAVVVVLVVVALLAGYLPARRATKVDPLVALRYE